MLHQWSGSTFFSVLSKRLPNEVESLCCHLLANHSLDACKPFIHATRGPHVHMFTTTSHFLRQRKQSLTSVSRGITESTCLDRWELNSLPHLILILCSIPCWWFRAWWRWSREPGTEGKMKSCISWWCAPSMNPSCVFELRGVANQERSLGDYRRRSIVNTDILATFCLMNKFSEFVILILHQHSVLYLTGGYQKPSSHIFFSPW